MMREKEKPMPPSKLAIVIPTYCRADLLAHGIERMAPALIANNVALYISDDSPDDDTETMLRRFSDRLPALHYRRNTPALRHDRNIVSTLLWPVEPYAWLVGDAGIVAPGGLERVLAILTDQDFLFVNSHAPETADTSRMTGEAARTFVRDMLWHQTLTGATVYSSRIRNWLGSHAPDARGLTTNFPHLAAILDFMGTHDVVVGWTGTRSTFFSPKESYWRKRMLSVFVEDWAAVVRRQPSIIHPAEQSAVLRSHAANTGLFGTDTLLELRRDGVLNAAYLHAHPDAWHALDKPAWLLRLITRLPLPILESGWEVAKRVRRASGRSKD